MAKEYFGKTDLVFLITLIHTEIAKYVKAVEGKGLSTNDFTNDLKNKLDEFDDSLYAKLSGSIFTGNVKFPTAVAGTNDTTGATTAFVVDAINTAMSELTGISFDGPYASYEALVAAVTQPKNGVIYLVSNSGSVPNASDEYYWNSKTSSFELFGSTSVDLSAYLKTADLTEISTEDVQAAWDGVFN